MLLLATLGFLIIKPVMTAVFRTPATAAAILAIHGLVYLFRKAYVSPAGDYTNLLKDCKEHYDQQRREAVAQVNDELAKAGYMTAATGADVSGGGTGGPAARNGVSNALTNGYGPSNSGAPIRGPGTHRTGSQSGSADWRHAAQLWKLIRPCLWPLLSVALGVLSAAFMSRQSIAHMFDFVRNTADTITSLVDTFAKMAA